MDTKQDGIRATIDACLECGWCDSVQVRHNQRSSMTEIVCGRCGAVREVLARKERRKICGVFKTRDVLYDPFSAG